jgi:hypothetical protein
MRGGSGMNGGTANGGGAVCARSGHGYKSANFEIVHVYLHKKQKNKGVKQSNTYCIDYVFLFFETIDKCLQTTTYMFNT